MKEDVPKARHGLYAQHLYGDCIRNGNVVDRTKFKKHFWNLQSSPNDEEYQSRFQCFSRHWPTAAKYLQKQEGDWRLMDFNNKVDGATVQTLGMKTNNMSEIHNNRVVDARMKAPLDMLVYLVQQACKDIVQSQISSTHHDGFLTIGAQEKCTTVQELRKSDLFKTMKAILHGLQTDDKYVYSVDFPESRSQSRSTHSRTVTLHPLGGGTCTCEQPPQTGIYCLHILIAEDEYALHPPDAPGTRRADDEVARMLRDRLQLHVHPCWQTCTWRSSVKDLIVHPVELQGLQYERLLPPVPAEKACTTKGRRRRKRFPSSWEKGTSRSGKSNSAADLETLPDDSSCSDVDEDECWDQSVEDGVTAAGSSPTPSSPASETLGDASPFVPTDYEICPHAPFENNEPTPQEMKDLMCDKRLLLHAFEDTNGDGATGWYIGKIKKKMTEATTSQADRPSEGPMPNCVVQYSARQTQHIRCAGHLVGEVATGLYRHNYGPGQWWVLLQKKATDTA